MTPMLLLMGFNQIVVVSAIWMSEFLTYGVAGVAHHIDGDNIKN